MVVDIRLVGKTNIATEVRHIEPKGMYNKLSCFLKHNKMVLKRLSDDIYSDWDSSFRQVSHCVSAQIPYPLTLIADDIRNEEIYTQLEGLVSLSQHRHLY